MSYPTILAPWYVVQQPARMPEYGDPAIPVQYIYMDDEGNLLWSEEKKKAKLFLSLHAASRVAKASAAEVRVITSQDELEEFRPKGMF